MKKACFGIVGVLALVALFSCEIDTARTVGLEGESAGGQVSGWYEVMGVTTHYTNETSPWSVTVASEKGDEVTLMVGDAAGNPVAVTGRIYVSGVLRVETTASTGGPFEMGLTVR